MCGARGFAGFAPAEDDLFADLGALIISGDYQHRPPTFADHVALDLAHIAGVCVLAILGHNHQISGAGAFDHAVDGGAGISQYNPKFAHKILGAGVVFEDIFDFGGFFILAAAKSQKRVFGNVHGDAGIDQDRFYGAQAHKMRPVC